MALELSMTAELLINQTDVNPQLILEIDGIPFIYGANPVEVALTYGGGAKYGDPGIVYGGTLVDENSRAYIKSFCAL